MKRNFTFSVVCNYSFFSATILCLTNNWKIKTLSLDGLVWTCTMSCQINKLSREKGGYPAENTFFERVEKIMLEEAAVCKVVCVCTAHSWMWPWHLTISKVPSTFSKQTRFINVGWAISQINWKIPRVWPLFCNLWPFFAILFH